MKKKCILHGGMPKTGSTSIQQAFFSYESSELVYAPLIVAAHTFPLRYLVDPEGRDRLNAIPARKMPKVIKKETKGLEKRFRTFLETNDKNVLISSEDLVNPGMLKRREDLVQLLEPYFDEIMFIAYVRSPEEYMVSALMEIFKDVKTPFDPRTAYPNYQSRFEPWIDTLGEGNVSLIQYDPSRFQKGNVVSDFAARLDVDDPATSGKRFNSTQSAESIAIQQLWNRNCSDGVSSFRRRSRISFGRRQVLTFGERQFGIDPDLLQVICHENREDIKWMEQRLGETFRPYEPRPDAMNFHSEKQFSQFAMDAEEAFWEHISNIWSWRAHSVPMLEAVGRTLIGEE